MHVLVNETAFVSPSLLLCLLVAEGAAFRLQQIDIRSLPEAASRSLLQE